MGGGRPRDTAVSIPYRCRTGRAGKIGSPTNPKCAEHGLHTLELRHAGRIVMHGGWVIRLCRKRIPHTGRSSALTLDTRNLSVKTARVTPYQQQAAP